MNAARPLLAAVRFYQRALSPAFPPRCRFEPSCSAYAAEALQVHGAARGSWLAVRRLAKCAPWHPGGLDLVPARQPTPGRSSTGTGTTGHTHSSGSAAPTGVQGRSAQQEARVA